MTRGRQRKKKRQQALKQEQEKTPEVLDISRGLGLSEPLLEDPHRVYEDTRIAGVAVKKRWDISDDKRRGLVDRLLGIVGTKSNIVLTKAGPFDSRSDADKNAVAAAKVIVVMEGQNQSDQNPKKGTEVNVNVGVQVIGDPALQQKAEQYGLTQSRLAGMIEANGHQNGHTNGNGHANGFHPNGSDAHD